MESIDRALEARERLRRAENALLSAQDEHHNAKTDLARAAALELTLWLREQGHKVERISIGYGHESATWRGDTTWIGPRIAVDFTNNTHAESQLGSRGEWSDPDEWRALFERVRHNMHEHHLYGDYATIHPTKAWRNEQARLRREKTKASSRPQG